MAVAALQGIRQETRTVRFASEQQAEAFEYGPYPMLMSGGWGSGKTIGGCLKGLSLSHQYPKNRGVIARHVGRDLRDTTMASFFKWCPAHLYDPKKGGRRNDQNGYVKLWESQSEILFLHLDDPETAGVIRGLEINWFLIDQAEENPEHMEELYDLLLGRLGRWDIAQVPQPLIDRHTRDTGKPWPHINPETGKPVPPPYPMLTCNPDVETHWLYKRFHPESPEHHELYAKQGYKMFHMPSTSNRFLGETNKRFLMAHDPSFIRRNVDGLWGQPEGAIHLVHPTSVLEGTSDLVAWLKNTCTLFRTFDYGDSAPTCCVWWAVDRNGNVFAYMEYYLPNAMISTHRANIAALSEGDRFEMNLADPSIFHKMPSKQGGRFSVSDEYAEVVSQPRHTALFWTPADNNELGTRNRINEYLRFDEDRIHPITHRPGSARLFFVTRTDSHPQGIVHALQQTRAQRRLKIGTNLGKPLFSDERDADVVDHAYDCVAPRMRVLTSDLRWVAAESLHPGDQLLAFDEHGSGRLRPRKWQQATVEAVTRILKPSVRLTMDDGSILECSTDHQWLTDPEARQRSQGAAGKRKWVAAAVLDGQNHWTKDRSRGLPCGQRRIVKPVDVWQYADCRDGGYLAGFFDGEGSVSRGVICAAQLPTVVMREACAAISRLGFKYTLDEGTNHAGVGVVRILGGRRERLRFLGTVRPYRLLEQRRKDASGRFDVSESATVVKAEPLGEIEVISITTSTHTFICEGFASHNCVRYFVASRPAAPPTPKAGTSGTFSGARSLMRKFRQRVNVR